MPCASARSTPGILDFGNAPIAQLDRAADYGSAGYRFNSYWVHHFSFNVLQRISPSPQKAIFANSLPLLQLQLTPNDYAQKPQGTPANAKSFIGNAYFTCHIGAEVSYAPVDSWTPLNRSPDPSGHPLEKLERSHMSFPECLRAFALEGHHEGRVAIR